MYETIIKLLDRLVSGWFMYRAGKSAVIKEELEKVLDGIKKAESIRNNNNDTSFEELLNNTGSHK